jgi:hypothetical protein
VTTRTKKAALASLAFLAAAPARADAPRAEVVDASTLSNEPFHHLLDISLLGQYAGVFEPSRVSGLANIGAFSLRTRLEIGKNPAYCVGLDGEIGGSTRGIAYDLTAYPVGFGARWGAGNTVALCGGAGFDGIGRAVPLAARFPAELSIAQSLGPLRPVLWVRPSWIAGAPSRREGSSISFVDELEAGLLVRLSRQHHYWQGMNAGGGLALGVSYREFMHTRYMAVELGFNFVGAQ